jgi:3-oxoadipate enol-lactonase
MPWIEANGVVLRYQRSGAGNRAVVLIHEMGGTLESWDFVAELLADSYSVLRFDLRSAGLSEWRSGELDIGDLSSDVVGLLDALGIAEPCAIIGCAVGAAVAVHFAAKFPSRTAALVAMSPAVGLPPERRAAALARAAQLEAEGMRPTAEEQLLKSYPPELRSDLERFRDVRARRKAANPFSAAAYGRMLAGLELSAELAAVACPTLVIAGRFDHIRPAEGVAETARLIRGSEMKVLDTGHFMPLQTPDLVAEAVRGFLAARWPAGAPGD